MDFSGSGKLTNIPFTGSFNGCQRDECLNIHWYLSLEDAQDKLFQFFSVDEPFVLS